MLILKTKTLTQRKRLRIFRRRCFYTQALLHTHTGASKQNFDTGACIYTEAFTHRSSYTQQQHTHTHTDAFCTQTAFPYVQMLVHRYFHIHTQARLHAEAFTHRLFHTQALLHTEASTHTHTQTHTHYDCCRGRFYTRKLGHTHTPKKKYTQKTFHAEAFTCRCFCTQKAFARKPIYTKVPLRTDVFTQNALAHRWGHTLLRTDAWRHRRLYT